MMNSTQQTDANGVPPLAEPTGSGDLKLISFQTFRKYCKTRIGDTCPHDDNPTTKDFPYVAGECKEIYCPYWAEL